MLQPLRRLRCHQDDRWETGMVPFGITGQQRPAKNGCVSADDEIPEHAQTGAAR